MKTGSGYSLLKTLICLALAASVIFCMAACSPENTEKPEEKNGEEDKMIILSDLSAADYYRNGFTNNYIVGIDQFGRTVTQSSGEKTDKERDVGIFYFCTLGQHGGDKIYDVSKILETENGIDVMFRLDTPAAPAGQGYFWGEPLYGYYNSSDSWVIRRHLALLSMAGVDFLVFDTTNAVTYDTVVGKIITESKRMKEAGWDVPGLAFYTNAYSHRVITYLYDTYYKKGKYSDVWYYLDGKPLIIGNVTTVADENEARGRGDKSYRSAEFSDEIKEFFTFRDSQWPNMPYLENGFPWIEWSYPAPVHNGVINVAVASHPALPMSFSITRGAQNWGRGWNVETGRNESEKAYEGQFFQSTWDVALREDPRIVFVLGWNEWVAGKNEYDGEYAMVDLADMEFSRDAEMMKGGYNDAFYVQLARNIRAYKGAAVPENAQLDSAPVTIPMTDDLSAWKNVQSVFRDTIVFNKARKSNGAAPSVHYETAARRNNVEEIRIAQDGGNFYFYYRASDDILSRENGDNSWMNLFIGTGTLEAKGWEGYEFIIGRGDAGEGKLTVEKLKPDFTSEKVGEAEYRIDGNVMQVKLPRAAIGIDAGVNNFYFKLADGVEYPSDIMDYYVTGLSFPMGRLSCRYIG